MDSINYAALVYAKGRRTCDNEATCRLHGFTPYPIRIVDRGLRPKSVENMVVAVIAFRPTHSALTVRFAWKNRGLLFMVARSGRPAKRPACQGGGFEQGPAFCGHGKKDRLLDSKKAFARTDKKGSQEDQQVLAWKPAETSAGEKPLRHIDRQDAWKSCWGRTTTKAGI